MNKEKISDLSFRKIGVLTAFVIAALLVTMTFIDQGADFTVDMKALGNHYGIFPLLFCAGAIGLIIQALCLKTAIESHKIYTLISVLILGYISYLFLNNYEVIYQYMDLHSLISNWEAGLIGVDQITNSTALIKETSDTLYTASTYMIAYGIGQFMIGLIPDAWMMKISETVSYKKNSEKSNQPKQNGVAVKETIIEEKINDEKKVYKKAFLINQTNNEKVEIKEELTVGKSKNCDYIIDDKYLNPQHARILKKDVDYVLVDCKTINHTYLNDEELIEEKEYLLQSGDYIIMADVEFQFVIETEEIV